MQNDLGLFPFDLSDAYEKELVAADEADRIAARIMVDPDYDWKSDEKTPIVDTESMSDLMQTLGVPSEANDIVTKPCRPSVMERNNGCSSTES